MWKQEYLLEQDKTDIARVELGSITIFYLTCLFVISSFIVGHFDIIHEFILTIMIMPVVYLVFVFIVNCIAAQFYYKIGTLDHTIVIAWVIIMCINSAFRIVLKRKFRQEDGFMFWPWDSQGFVSILLILAPDYVIGADIIHVLTGDALLSTRY